MDRKRSLAIGAVISLTAAIAACGGATPAQSGQPPAQATPPTKVGPPVPQTIKATLATATDIGNDELSFAASAKTLSSGAIDITVTGYAHSGDPASEAELIADVVAGKSQLALVSARGFDTAGVNSFEGLQAPMLIDSYDLEAKVLSTDWAKKLLDGPRSVGVVGLGYFLGELRQPLGITRSLASVSDFQGARIGIRPSHVTEMTMQALGATTVPQAALFNLSGLDGIEMGAPGVAGNDFYVGAKSFSGNLIFWPRPNVIIANANWFDALSADQQAQLRTAATATDQAAVDRLRDNAREARDKFCAGGFSSTLVSSDALDALRQRLQPVIDEMAKDPGTKATIDAITALRGSTDAPDVVAPCPLTVPSPSPNSSPTALDGKWKTSFTKDDLISSPFLVGAGDINDENWGEFTVTFENGHFTLTQTNPIAHSSNSATFTVTGDAVILAQDNGETWAYQWSIFRDTLTFKRDPSLSFGGPAPMLVRPWTRVP